MFRITLSMSKCTLRHAASSESDFAMEVLTTALRFHSERIVCALGKAGYVCSNVGRRSEVEWRS